MRYSQTSIPGLWLIEPAVLRDERGHFLETFRREDFAMNIGALDVVQENESRSRRGVLRGLHLQTGEHAQAKLIRCVEGEVLDVAVDLRHGSPTFGQHISMILSSENHRQLFVPRGFAHGFLTLSEYATIQYKVDNAYNASSECSLRYDDPALGINWQVEGTEDMPFVLSRKDLEGISFELYKRQHLFRN
ncbi:MAG: dTDP-4-dehydrorhamnose 3,5-epimerase [Porphyromonas sp.]|nr:dTDP-4-dehydrorhamnose 3,5-epimerase [Porphyromonas sp.]